MPDAEPHRLFSRRGLFRLAGAGVGLALTTEAVRVFGLTNIHTVIPGRVYRTAQLTGPELSRFIAAHGIRTVINLRGLGPDAEWFQAEARATHSANICQEDITLSAKRLPPPAEVRRLIEVLDHTEYPIVFHCQRGADRTGLTATIVMLLQPGVSVAEARRQIGPRFGHLRAGRTAVIDEFFDLYEEWLASTNQEHAPDLFRHWASAVYIPGPFWAELALLEGPNPRVAVGRGFALTVRATNKSIRPWTFKPGRAGGIHLRYRIYRSDGSASGKLYEGRAGLFQATIPPGSFIDLRAAFPPLAAPGPYPAYFDLLDGQAIDLLDADFVQYGSEPLMETVTVT